MKRVLVLCAVLCGVFEAHADPFDWSLAERIQTTSFPQSPLDGGDIEVRYGVEGITADLQRIAIITTWSDGRDTVEHALLDTLCMSSSWNFRLHHSSGKTVLTAYHGPCSRYDDEHATVTERWEWDPTTRHFTNHTWEVHSPYAVAHERIRRLLQEGQLQRASELLASVGTTPNGGHTYDDEEVFQAFFDATWTAARAAQDAGDATRAAELLSFLVAHPPSDVRSPACAPNPDVLVVAIAEPSQSCVAFNVLDPTPRNVQRLHDLARWGYVGGVSPEHVLPLLEQVLVWQPERTQAQLDTADVLAALGQEERALTHYQRYAEQIRARGEAVPERVKARIGE